MNPELRQRVRIDGSLIGIVPVISLGRKTVLSVSLDPPIPKGSYVEIEFIFRASENEPATAVDKFPGLVVRSSGDRMEVRLENMNEVYIELLELFTGDS